MSSPPVRKLYLGETLLLLSEHLASWTHGPFQRLHAAIQVVSYLVFICTWVFEIIQDHTGVGPWPTDMLEIIPTGHNLMESLTVLQSLAQLGSEAKPAGG